MEVQPPQSGVYPEKSRVYPLTCPLQAISAVGSHSMSMLVSSHTDLDRSKCIETDSDPANADRSSKADISSNPLPSVHDS